MAERVSDFWELQWASPKRSPTSTNMEGVLTSSTLSGNPQLSHVQWRWQEEHVARLKQGDA